MSIVKIKIVRKRRGKKEKENLSLTLIRREEKDMLYNKFRKNHL